MMLGVCGHGYVSLSHSGTRCYGDWKNDFDMTVLLI